MEARIIRRSIVTICREECERRGLTFTVGHDSEHLGGRQVYVINGKSMPPGEALAFLGVEWPEKGGSR